MTLKNYLTRAMDLFDDKKRRCNRDKQCLNTVLAKLKRREEALNAQLREHLPDNVRKAIEREQKVVVAQRNKALKIIGKLGSTKNDTRYGAPHFAR